MRWLRLVGSIIALVGALLFYAKTILDWIGRLDLVLSHRTEIGGALEYVLAPPWWLPWCVLLSGLALIWADTQRRAKAPGAAPADIARERKLTRSSAAVKATKRLSPSDKDRLANALSDLSKLFDDRVWMPTHITVHNVLSAANDYSKPISPNIQQYRDQLIKLSEAARDYRDKFAETQKKWKYYSLQISYIMEDDSDSDHGERGFEDAINGFQISIDGVK